MLHRLNRALIRSSPLIRPTLISNSLLLSPVAPRRLYSAESAKEDPTLLGRMTIDELPISHSIKMSLKKQFAFADLTLVQEKAIPVVLDTSDKRDVIVQSKTGSGKTLAFLIPLVESILRANMEGRPRVLRALILSPTRELAIQIEDVLRRLIFSLGRDAIRHDIMMGGLSVSYEEKKLVRWVTTKSCPEIIVATPGRLLMHLENMPEFGVVSI
jgi:superfamily II DNA/RNA helicase